MPKFAFPFRRTDTQKYGSRAVLGGAVSSIAGGKAAPIGIGRARAETVLDKEKVERFLSEQLLEAFRAAELKSGEVSHAYAVHGWGVAASAEVDFGSLVAPSLLTLVAKAKLRAEVCDAMFVALMRFQQSRGVEQPFLLAILTGYSYAVSGSLGAEVGIKVGLGTFGVKGTETEKEERSFKLEAGNANHAKGLECANLKLEAKIVAQGSATVEIAGFQARAESPLFYRSHDDPTLQRYLGALLGGGAKADLKLHAIRFLEDLRARRPELNVEIPHANWLSERLWNANPKLTELQRCLTEVTDKFDDISSPYSYLDPQVREDANSAKYHTLLLGNLRERRAETAAAEARAAQAATVGGFNSKILREFCFVSVFASKTQLTRGVEAKAEASIAAQGAEAGAAVNWTNAWMWSTNRFQTFVPLVASGSQRPTGVRLMTQDAAIKYVTSKRELTAEASASFLNVQQRTEFERERQPQIGDRTTFLAAVREEARLKQRAFYLEKNTLTYSATTLVWDYPATGRETPRCVEGCGVSYGASVSWKSLKELSDLAIAADDPLCLQLASALAVEPVVIDQWLVRFTAERATLETTYGLNDESDVILETAFAVEPTTLPASLFVLNGSAWQANKVEFSAGELQSIRLRRRLYDCVDDTRVRFKLGAKLAFIAEIKVELEEVSRAGKFGTETLLWVGRGARETATEQAETDVPEVMLFHL